MSFSITERPPQLSLTTSPNMGISASHLLLATTLFIPLSGAIYLDYQHFLSLGPGGTPQTIAGYLRLKLLSLFTLRDPHTPPPIPYGLVTKTGHLSSHTLPKRAGLTLPKTAGIAPHRQLTQKSTPEVYRLLCAAISQLASQCPDLELKTSCFEKYSTGLFAADPQRRTCGGEICHAHPSDGSMHLTLHPADAKVLLEQRWGERHPLARGGWLERFVPGGFVMVYAPRTEAEVEVVVQIIKAAAWWVADRRFHELKESKDSAAASKDSQNPVEKLAAKACDAQGGQFCGVQYADVGNL